MGGVNPFLFSQLCLYHYAEISKEHNFGVQSIYHKTDNGIQSNPCKLAHLAKKVQPPFLRKDGLIGQVTIGNRQQPICIPVNSTTTILECTNKLPLRTICLVDQVEHHNLPFGIVVSMSVANPKGKGYVYYNN